MKNIKWAVFFIALCVVCAAVWLVRSRVSTENAVAVIKLGDKVIRTIDLSEVYEPYEFEITAENGGYNLIRAEQGRIAVIEADCPDQICVGQGYIENSAVPVVCLPHKLSITIMGREDEDMDALAGGL